MTSEELNLECGDLVVLNTDNASVKRNLTPDKNYYVGFYKTIVPVSTRPSSGWRRWIGPKNSRTTGIIIGPSTNRPNEKLERVFVLWDGEIVEARCNHLKKVTHT